MDTAKLFKSGQSQAVRLPKGYRFRGREVFIEKVGDTVVLFPRRNRRKLMREALELSTDDFMADRDQPKGFDKRPPIEPHRGR